MVQSTNKTRTKSEDQFERLIIYAAIAFGVLGFVVIIWLLFQLTGQYRLIGYEVNLEATAQFGDYIGGFVGSLWSLVGILLFYSALRLQRKEFELQRIELRDQRQEFAITRITDVIYRQLELLENKAAKLRFNLEINKVNLVGESVISEVPVWFANYFPSNKPIGNDQKEIFDIFVIFLLSRQVKEHLRFLGKTIDVCIKLIDQKEEFHHSRNTNYVLNDDQRMHLYLLLSGNLDLFAHQIYLQIIKRINQEQVNRAKRIKNTNVVPDGVAYFSQQIDTLDALIERLFDIQNSSRLPTKSNFER